MTFSISATCLVDLRCTTDNEAECSPLAKFACSLNPKQLSKIFTSTIMGKRKTIDNDVWKRGAKLSGRGESSLGKPKVFLSDSFQEIMTLQMFGLNVSA